MKELDTGKLTNLIYKLLPRYLDNCRLDFYNNTEQ